MGRLENLKKTVDSLTVVKPSKTSTILTKSRKNVSRNKGIKAKGRKPTSKKQVLSGKKGGTRRLIRRRTAEDNKPVLFLSHLPHGFYANEIKEFFKQFGDTVKVSVPRSEKTGGRKGYAYVQFSSLEVATIAAQTMNNHMMSGKILKCEVMPSDNVISRKLFTSNFDENTCPRAMKRKALNAKMNRSLTKLQQTKEELKAKRQYKRKVTQLRKAGVVVHLPGVPLSAKVQNLETLRQTYNSLWQNEELLFNTVALESVLLKLKDQGHDIEGDVPHPSVAEIREQMEAKVQELEAKIQEMKQEEKKKKGKKRTQAEILEEHKKLMESLLDELKATLLQEENQVKFQEAFKYYEAICKEQELEPTTVIAQKKKRMEKKLAASNQNKEKETSNSEEDNQLEIEVDESDDEIQIKTPPNAVKKYIKITPSSPARKPNTPKSEGKTLEEPLAKTLFKKKGIAATPNQPKQKMDTPETVKIVRPTRSKENTPLNRKETPGKRKLTDEQESSVTDELARELFKNKATPEKTPSKKQKTPSKSDNPQTTPKTKTPKGSVTPKSARKTPVKASGSPKTPK